MSDQHNVGATSETAQTRKTIHTKHSPIHTNKANMEWWLRRPNDIRGPCGPKVSRHLSYRWGKTPKKPHPGNVSRPGIELGPAVGQARMLPLAPQRWTVWIVLIDQNFCGIGIEHWALQSPTRKTTVWKQDTVKEGKNTWCGITCSILKRGRGEFIFYRTLSVAYH